MLIVIEGVDRTGKSTLAKRIAKQIDAEIIHAGPPTRGSIEEYETTLNGYDPNADTSLILDRWHVGEHVWPSIFGRKTDMDLAVKRHVDMFMESRGAVVVHGIRDAERLKKELIEHREPLHPEDLQKAVHLFTEARTFSSRQAWSWDYERSSQEDIDNIVLHAKSKAKELSQIWDTCGPGFITGSLVPTQILVGDEQGPHKNGTNPPYRVPFAPYPATSGHYLLSQLENWRTSLIVNSRDRDTLEKYDLRKLCHVLDNTPVCALGWSASRALHAQGVEHEVIPHPQYWRRFHHHKKEQYTKMLSGR